MNNPEVQPPVALLAVEQLTPDATDVQTGSAPLEAIHLSEPQTGLPTEASANSGARNQRLQKIGRRVAAAALTIGIAFPAAQTHTEAQPLVPETVPAAEFCIEPTAADIALVEHTLANPQQPFIATISGWAGNTALYPKIATDGSDVYADAFGVKTYQQLFTGHYDHAWLQGNDEQQRSILTFKSLQTDAKEYYGVDISLMDEDSTYGEGSPRESHLEAIAPGSLSTYDIEDLSRTISQLPSDFFKLSDVQKIELFHLKDGNVGGYYDRDNHLITLQDDNAGGLPHEVGHALDNAAKCMDEDADHSYAAGNAGFDYNPAYWLGGSDDKTIRSIDSFNNQAYTAFAETITNPDDFDPDKAIAAYEQAHPEKLASIVEKSAYGLQNKVEGKAELYNDIFNTNPDGFEELLGINEIMRRKATLLIGRIAHMSPNDANFIIIRHGYNQLLSSDTP